LASARKLGGKRAPCIGSQAPLLRPATVPLHSTPIQAHPAPTITHPAPHFRVMSFSFPALPILRPPSTSHRFPVTLILRNTSLLIPLLLPAPQHRYPASFPIWKLVTKDQRRDNKFALLLKYLTKGSEVFVGRLQSIV
jgi:hypothetical protein